MGYYSGICILGRREGHAREATVDMFEPVPQKVWPSKHYVLWEFQAYLNFDRTTRMEKMVSPRYAQLEFRGRERAAICVISSIFPKLSAKSREWSKKEFAPPFALFEENNRLVWERKHLDYAVLAGGEEFVVPPYHDTWRAVYDPETMVKHNRAIASEEVTFKTYLENSYSIIMDAPLMWETCTKVAEWMREAEEGDTEESRQLKLDPSATAFARAWRLYLEEMGKIGAMALFTFPLYPPIEKSVI